MTQPHSASTSHSNTASTTSKTLSNSLKNPREKPQLSLHKHELKALAQSMALFAEKTHSNHHSTPLSASYLPLSPNNQSRHPQSYYSPSRKGPDGLSGLANEKRSTLVVSVDKSELQESQGNFKKVDPLDLRTIKSLNANGVGDKGKKVGAGKGKKGHLGNKGSGQDNVGGRKSPMMGRETSNGKTGLFDKPGKKASLPHNLTLSMSNLYAGLDINSYRAIVSSRASEHPSSVGPNRKQQLVGGTKVREKRKLVENENGKTVEKESDGFNKLLVELDNMPSGNQGKNVPKISINNINNINMINNSQVEDKMSTLRAVSSYSDFNFLLNEKDDEIERLTRDKMELKGVLGILLHEINDRKQGKSTTKEKDEALGSLMLSLIQALGSNEETKQDDLDSEDRQSNFQRKSSRPNAIQDMEKVKTIASQLRVLTDSPERTVNKSEDVKSNLLETLIKDNLRQARKSNNVEKEGKEQTSKLGRSATSALDLYQRSFSTTGDIALGKKLKESPYCESMRGPVKKGGKSGGNKRPIMNMLGNGSGINTKRREGKKEELSKGKLYLETSRTQDIESETERGLVRTQPSTTMNAGMDMLKRKFSHDPKMMSQAIAEMLEKKQSVANFDKLNSSERRTDRREEEQGEKMDIRNALDGLKGRIAKVLGNRKMAGKQSDAIKIE